MLTRIIWVVIALAAVITIAAAIFATDYYGGLPVDAQATYIGRQSCVECHAEQAQLFSGSYHDLAMDAATSDSVLASFDDQTIEHFGIKSKAFKKDGKFFVNTEGPDGEMADFEVKYVFGHSPLQQYIVALDEKKNSEPNQLGRMQVLRLSWDTEKEEWFYLSPPDVDTKLQPGDPLHWTGITQCWNTSCADCHSTNLQKNFDINELTYETTFSEIDVSCEACHGPASLHVEIARNKTFFWDRHHGKGLTKLKGANPIPQIEACAKCHSRRAILTESFKPGDPFHDHFSHEVLNDSTYFADGQIKDEDYVYGSFIQSKMFHKGIRCTDCHDPHSTKVKFDGNQLCTSCHQHPAGKYDSPTHHQHKVGSTGASCVECHMPEVTYMEVDPRRDHSIRVPRPDLSVKLGTPNACTKCHLDPEKLPVESRSKVTQYIDWIAEAKNGNKAIADELQRVDKQMLEAVEKWYGKKEYEPHFSEIFIAARKGDETALDDLQNLIKDRNAAAIVRATATVELNQFSGEKAAKIALSALNDDDPSVVSSALERVSIEILNQTSLLANPETRSNANEMLEKIIGEVSPLLENEIRLVRTQSARTLVSIPPQILVEKTTSAIRRQIEKAIDEFEAAQMASAERERAHMVVGRLHEETGEFDKAIKHYRNAMRVEPSSTNARRNLAALYENRISRLTAQGRAAAQQGNREFAIQIGNEIQNLADMIDDLRAKELELLQLEIERIGDDPNAASLYYQYGTSLYLAERVEEAEEYLKKAADLEPEVTRFTLALAYLYQKFEEWEKAIPLAERLLKIDPNNETFIALMNELKAARKSN